MDVLGRQLDSRKRKLDVDDLSAKRLRVGVSPTSYSFPEEKGDAGQILVQQSDGTLDFETPSSAGNAVLENVLVNPMEPWSFNTPIQSNTSQNRFQYALDPMLGHNVLFNDTPALPGSWNANALAGSCFIFFTVEVPAINISDSSIVLRLWAQIGGINSGDWSAAQDSCVCVWVQQDGDPLPAPDDGYPQLAAKFIYINQRLEPTGNKTNLFNAEPSIQSNLYEVPISGEFWGGKVVRVGLWFKSSAAAATLSTPQGAKVYQMELITRSRGNGVASLPPALISHTLLQNIGTNTHPQLDSHVASTALHWNNLSKTLNSNQSMLFGDANASVVSPVSGTLQLAASNSILLNGVVNVPSNLSIGNLPGADYVEQQRSAQYYYLMWRNGFILTPMIIWDLVGGLAQHFYASEFAGLCQFNQSARFGSVGTDYLLPTTRAAAPKYILADLLGNGTATWESLAAVTGGYFYGDAYFQSNATPTLFGAINAYVPVLGVMVANLTSSFSLQGNALRNDSSLTRTYKIDVSGSFISGGNNDEIYQVAVYVGGVLVPSSQIRCKLDNVANNYPITFALACLANVAPTNLVQVFARNTVSTQSLLVIDLSLTVVNISL